MAQQALSSLHWQGTRGRTQMRCDVTTNEETRLIGACAYYSIRVPLWVRREGGVGACARGTSSSLSSSLLTSMIRPLSTVIADVKSLVSRYLRSREPSPGADVEGESRVPGQMWQG